MKVLSVHRGTDTAGIGYLLAEAFRGDPEITLRSAVRRDNWIGYPHDLDWADAETHWAAADIVHVHNSLKTWRLLGGDKPFVLHHHGTWYRQHAEELDKAVAEHGGRAIAATLDLLDYGDATWCPAPFDLDRLARFRKPRDGRLRVGHSPTDRAVKGTAAFLAACEKLDVEPVLIEHQPWAECLRIKGTCDVFYDQAGLGYGHSAIEAWAMGIPVIAGAAPAIEDRMTATFGGLPYYPTTEATIAGAIRDMMRPEVRAEFAERGVDHAKRWHDGSETRRILTGTYRSLI